VFENCSEIKVRKERRISQLIFLCGMKKEFSLSSERKEAYIFGNTTRK
jgi:hypothetical protein